MEAFHSFERFAVFTSLVAVIFVSASTNQLLKLSAIREKENRLLVMAGLPGRQTLDDTNSFNDPKSEA